MHFFKIKNFFWILFIVMLVQIIKINYAYSQTPEQLWEQDKMRYDALDEFDKVLSKGTSKSEVLSYLGRPDKTEKNVFFGYEVWHYNNVYVYNENMGSWGIVFRDDKIVDISDELFPPEWVGWKQVMQIVFFPAYVLLAIPGVFFLTVPCALFCLVGVFIFSGWWRFFCVYLLLGYISMIIPWIFLVSRK